MQRERERESSDRKSEFMKNGVEGRKLGRKKERKERKIRREEKQKSREKGIKQRANHLNRYIWISCIRSLAYETCIFFGRGIVW